MRLFPPPPDDRTSAVARDGLTLRHLAHELNSLLDGSMRNIRLAHRALNAIEGEVPDADRHLRAAQDALDDVAAVLRRALTAPTGPARLLEMGRTVGVEVDRVLAALLPAAAERSVDLSMTVSPAAAVRPAGPLGAVLANGLRNAIQACGRVDSGERRVEGSIAIRRERLLIVIRDTGPGLGAAGEPPVGHGLGLGVCRAIVAELGGVMSLATAPDGRGAVLEIEVPAGAVGPPSGGAS